MSRVKSQYLHTCFYLLKAVMELNPDKVKGKKFKMRSKLKNNFKKSKNLRLSRYLITPLTVSMNPTKPCERGVFLPISIGHADDLIVDTEINTCTYIYLNSQLYFFYH